MSSSSGQLVGEVTRYYPFGDYRSGGPNAITDKGFTGQKENMELGLYYYNARFYVPGIGRFASADTIVPNPANPQSFNRYSYTFNNPVKLVDPSGHCALASDGQQDSSDQECWDQYFDLYEYLHDKIGLESPGLLIGSGKDWLLLASESYINQNGDSLELMSFLQLRKQHHEITGYYCESVTCIEEDLLSGGGTLSSLIPPDLICGGLAATGIGAAAACTVIDTVKDASSCVTDGINYCGANYLAEGILSKYVPGSEYLSDKTGLEVGDWISGEPTGTFDTLVTNLAEFFQSINDFFAPPVYAPEE